MLPSPEPSAFSLLHRSLQEQLYRMQWTSLRAIQTAAIREVLLGSRHLLLSAQTAGGKTEAAFLPILSQIVEDHGGGVRALYVSPLRALINDQFRRLEDLCERAEIPVHRWHGDVSQAARRNLVDRPGGVLLITPESIESLFLNRSGALGRIFGRLQWIVVDELHAFPGSERGAQLRSLLYRVEARAQHRVRLAALSATIGDPEEACRWLRPGAPDAFRIILDDWEREIRYQVRGYLRTGDANDLVSPEWDDDLTDDAVPAPPETEADGRLAADVFHAFYGKTALVFANSRTRLEFYADLARREAARRRLPDRFAVHHGSLSRAEREGAEAALRSDTPTVTFCSSTLELGIDVGRIQEVGQIGPPWSVSSLLQRLGRSGRREGEFSVMRLYIEENEPPPLGPASVRLFPRLLQAVAMSELLLDHWCEPPEVDGLHLSTLIQQVMSVIAEHGGARADRLYDHLVTRGAFRNVDQAVFVATLRGMGAADLIEQTPDGDLILGVVGEKLVRRFDFYAVFKTGDEYRVVCQGRTIGTVQPPLDAEVGSYLILAGRRWRILDTDVQRRELLVAPSRGGKVPYFPGVPDPDVHPRVREKMREILFQDRLPAYLDSSARDMLRTARAAAREAELDREPFFQAGNTTWWFPWAGSRVQRALWGLGRFIAGLRVEEEEMALVFEDSTPAEIRAAYTALLPNLPAAETLALRFPILEREKYDEFLPRELQALCFARRCLDVAGAAAVIRTLASNSEPTAEADQPPPGPP